LSEHPAGSIGCGVIGTGYMGACHAQALIAVAHAFEPRLRPRLEMVADVTPAAAEAARARFGFARASTDWRALVADPAIELVSITTPNILHKEMALAALAAGKHVWCEKPLALTAADTTKLVAAAERAGTTTLVGYNYLRSPAVAFAKKLIDGGEIGAVTQFRAIFDEDFMGPAAFPFSWRCERAKAGTGALGDMGSHLVNLAHYLVGPISEVAAGLSIAIQARHDAAGHLRQVENDDVSEVLVRFANGAIGHIGCSRIAWGRKNGLDFELYGRNGGIRFTQERFNEIQLFKPADRHDDNGFRTILTGPPHEPFGRFTPGWGHGIGFNDLKVIEAAHLLQAIADGTAAWPDFTEGHRVEVVCEAIARSAASRRWELVDAS
jgi:predicted dehydrogenase